MEGSRIVPSITCPEIPGRTYFLAVILPFERNAMCLLRLVFAMLVVVTPGLVAQSAQFETTEIADGVYQFRWESHNTCSLSLPMGSW